MSARQGEQFAALGGAAISTQLRLGDLLIRAKIVTEQDVAKALQRLSLCGGRLGDNLVAIGAITKDQLEKFLHRTPREPENIAATGLDEADLLALLLKLMYVNRLQTVRQFADAIKLPYNIVLELVRMAVDRLYLQNLGARNSDSLIDLARTRAAGSSSTPSIACTTLVRLR